ncbi:MAG: YraN family protein [Candidatus Gastranaerophilales bacterium]|nr:YraN family protein [Candidatus Gastranaerophilales bacterium]
MNRRQIGSDKEQLAADHLEKCGMRIVERNFRCPMGEIDMIGYHGKYLVFVEVKYRSGTNRGSAKEAVDGRKQSRICRAADWYRQGHGLGEDTWVRYDVVALQGEEISWIQNAFPHCSSRRGRR